MHENFTQSIKPSTIRELADMYQVSVWTLKNWLKPFDQEIGKRTGHLYTTLQIRIIYEKIGPPPTE
jgi:hypothetical protein